MMWCVRTAISAGSVKLLCPPLVLEPSPPVLSLNSKRQSSLHETFSAEFLRAKRASVKPPAGFGFGVGAFQHGLQFFGRDAAGFEEQPGSKPVMWEAPWGALAADHFTM